MTTRGTATSHSGIRRLGRNKWHLRVSLRDPRTGKKRDTNKVVDDVDFNTAVRAWEDLRDELQSRLATDGVVPERRTCELTLTGYVQRWLEHATKTELCRKHVMRRMIDALERYVLPLIGHLNLADITPQTLARWSEQLSGLRQQNGEPYAVETLSGGWRTLRAILNDSRMLVGFKVDLDGYEFHVAGKPPKAKDVLTRSEMLAVLDAAQHESIDVRAMIWLGFTTGMRFCELSSLRWEDIDLERGVVKIQRSQVGGVVGPTKTETNRSVTLLDSVREMLREHREDQRKRLVDSVEPGLVFPSAKGTYRTPSMMTKPLRRCVSKAGVAKNVSAHTMRRTFNNLVRQSAGDIAARAMMGHVSAEMTEHYSDVTVEEKRQAQLKAFGDLGVQSGGSTRWVDARFGGSTGSNVKEVQ